MINNYKGKYQLQAEIDKRTGDFCRDKNGNLENYTDLWIECYGGRIFHYGGKVLEYYSNTLGKGRNILKAINQENSSLIYDVIESDGEVIFKFKTKDFNKLEQYIRPKTNCADRSPFSVKNIRNKQRKNGVEKYSIPSQDLELYKQISSLIPKDDISIYNKINKGFIDILSKKMRIHSDDLKNRVKISGLKPKEYFHSLGEETWTIYLNFMKKYNIKQGD